MKLPKDLRHYRTKKILKRVIPCTITVAALAVVMILWGDIVFPIDEDYAFTRSLCYAIVLAVPFIVFGVPLKLLDKSYMGVIRHLDIKAVVDSPIIGLRNTKHLSSLYGTNMVTLVIENEENKLEVVAVNTSRLHNAEQYKEGERIFHLYATELTVILPNKGDTHCQCAVCGSINEIANDVCEVCRHTLMK